MDDALRNGLWNDLTVDVFSVSGFDIGDFSSILWRHYFKKPIDDRPIRHDGYSGANYKSVWSEIRSHYFACHWYEVYEFVEFVLVVYAQNRQFRKRVQGTLLIENAGFRLINDSFVPISDEVEVQEVTAAAENSLTPVSTHIKSAIDHLSSKTNPDYRNSIKESISAVESMARAVTGDTRATLGDALRTLERRGALHPAMKEAFSKMYGYTNDADGIRHALVDEGNLTQADARYFLVVCSAFINLLKAQVQ